MTPDPKKYDGASKTFLRDIAQQRYNYLSDRVKELPVEIGRLKDELDESIQEKNQLDMMFEFGARPQLVRTKDA